MKHGILQFSADILALERNGKWKSAAELAYRQWVSDPQNINLLCCAGTEMWCALLEMDYYKFNPFRNPDMEFDDTGELSTLLQEVAAYGEKNFAESACFNAYFGHMYTVMPFNFSGYDGDYDGWNKHGESMIHKAYLLEPANLFVTAMACSCKKKDNFINACSDFWCQTTPSQWGTGMVARYFFHILNGAMFYPDTFKYD